MKATNHRDSESTTDDLRVEEGEELREHRVISLPESNLAPPVDAAVAAQVARDSGNFPVVKPKRDKKETE